MTAPAAKPVKLTQIADEDDYEGPTPKNLVVIGAIPSTDSEITPQEEPAIDASPADAAAVATDLQAVVDALVAAGVFTASA